METDILEGVQGKVFLGYRAYLFTAHREDIEKCESARLMSQHMVSGGQILKPERDRFTYALQRGVLHRLHV